MMQIQKYPPKTIFHFSRLEGKHDILLYIKCAKTTPLQMPIFFRPKRHKRYLIV
jgi:hypothetical protein